ncbi:hypothetical protein F2Q70_00024346 [Brassica cretica]|uniref:Uncharacterized protein n=1 Tax=Brassica cretica TaxID=69181 RepID=A0A8S9LD33_BRACR|nr:hypothetical protein F2Q70_00024346 [Brassica cretica]
MKDLPWFCIFFIVVQAAFKYEPAVYIYLITDRISLYILSMSCRDKQVAKLRKALGMPYDPAVTASEQQRIMARVISAMTTSDVTKSIESLGRDDGGPTAHHSGAGFAELRGFSLPRRRRARQSTPVQAEVDSVETKTRSLSGRAHTRRRSSPELVDGGEDREKPYDFSKTEQQRKLPWKLTLEAKRRGSQRRTTAPLLSEETNPEEKLYAPWIYTTNRPPGGKSDVMRGEAATLLTNHDGLGSDMTQI